MSAAVSVDRPRSTAKQMNRSDWRTARVGDLVKVINGRPFNSNRFGPEGWPLIRIRDLNRAETETRYEGAAVSTAIVTSDDVLIGMDGDFNVGRWLSSEPALLNQRMVALRGQKDILTFLQYALEQPLRAINETTYATTVKHLSSGQVRAIRVSLPNDPGELQLLADFLDQETGEIDAFIRDQEELIGLMQERRAATISHAVTRGFDSNVPMQDSGVDWLGLVPTSWTTRPLWTMFHRIKDTGHPEEMMLSVFREYGVVEKNSRENLNKTAENRDIYQLIQPGWLVANRMKAWQGSVGISRHRGIISGHYLCFAPRHQESSDFLNFLFRSGPYEAGYAALSRGVRIGQAEIDNDQYRLLPVLLPPLNEQHEIVQRLEEELADIDEAIADAHRAVVLSGERRFALISAAVTGKVDLREHR